MRYLFILSMSVLAACESSAPVKSEPEERVQRDTVSTERENASLIPEKAPSPQRMDTLEQKLISHGLVDVESLGADIRVDLKYTTTDNFLKEDLYGGLDKAYIQPEVGEMLVRAQAALKEAHPEYSLLVYDAVRPLSVQWKMWHAMDHMPVNLRTKYVSNPANGSVHNYGAAVDLTVVDENGEPLDMGAGYDDFREIAYPRLEAQFLESGELTKEQYQNRLILRKAMKAAGFRQLTTEWWHYNAFSRDAAKQKFQQVK